jgi:Lysylphosphatidylglycerol synthase TM region
VQRKRIVNIVFVLAAVGVSAFVIRELVKRGWPLHHANFWLVGLAAALLLLAYSAKAWGWRHLFLSGHRPATLTLAAAGGAASVAGIALPGRCDELVRFAVVRRCRRRRVSFGAVALSIFLLGLLDAVALAPFASVAAGVSNVGWWIRAGLIVVAVAGVAAAAVVMNLGRLSRYPLLARFRLAGWVGEHAATRREAGWAWLGVAVSWVLRALAVFVLLAALGLGTDFAMALGFLCASSASAALPIAPAGAATQAGAGAAMLIASGMHSGQAIAFGVASQGLGILTGAVFVVALGAWHAHGRLPQLARRFAHA